MKLVFASIMIAPLVLAGSLPAIAQSTSAPRTETPGAMAAVGDPSADRETYTQRARDDMQEWQQKLHDLGEKTQADAMQAHTTAGNDLNRAWTRTEAAARRLETASARDWDRAKASFERATHQLDLAWRKVDPEGK